MREFRAFSYGTGEVDRSRLAGIGEGVVIEHGALIFDPESVTLGSNVYIGHYVILRGYKGSRLEIGDDIDLSMAWKLSYYVADAFGLPVPINQVGVGANAFAHESGIHADGMLKDRHNYEIYDYELLGRSQWSYLSTGRVITTGEYGGMNGLRHVYEQLGITFKDGDAALQVLNLVQAANAHNQMQLSPDELRFIAEHPFEVHKLLSLSIPDPAEQIGVRRFEDLIEQVDQDNDHGDGSGVHVPWTEVAPRRLSR